MKAYPYSHKHPTTGLTASSEGMDLRDYFAAMAMQGLLAHYGLMKIADFSLESYKMADAMMKERSKKDEQS